jgi:hypothetical protein
MARAEWGSTTRFVEQALEILEAEQPMTIRQLFYRLVSAGVIANHMKDYKRVSRTMTKVRDDGRCPFAWIVDRSRPSYEPHVFQDAHGYMEACRRSYRKDYWAKQPKYVEVWVEKDAIIGAIQQVTDELGVTVRVGRGFLSATKAHETATILASKKKPKIVFYLGDHDPSGQCLEQDIKRRILRYSRVHHQASIEQDLNPSSDAEWLCAIAETILRQCSNDFTLQRLAIHPEDIRKFKLPPLRVKDSDSRSASFRAKHGDHCVELDALPPVELRRRLSDAIISQLDMEVWNRAIEIETAELTSIQNIVDQWPKEEAGQ